MHKKIRKELSDLYFVFFKKHLTNGLRCAIICKYSRVPAVLAQLDRVPGYEPVGRGFESLTPCQRKAIRNSGWLFLCMVLWDETPVQVAGKTRTFLSAATKGSGAQLDAELARRGSESLTPCQNKSPMA